MPHRSGSRRRALARLRTAASWVAVFGFFSIWIAIALAPLLRFRVSHERSLPAAVKRIESIALDVARNSPVTEAAIELGIYR